MRVSVYDGYTRSATETVTINVTNLNDNAPVITAGQSYRIDGGAEHTVAKCWRRMPTTPTSRASRRSRAGRSRPATPNNVFRFNGTGELQVARPLLVDWRRTSYSLGSTRE